MQDKNIRPIQNWADYLNYRKLTHTKEEYIKNPIVHVIENISDKTTKTAEEKRIILKIIYGNLNVKGGKAPIDEAPDKYVHAAFQRIISGSNEKPTNTYMINQLKKLKKESSPVQIQIREQINKYREKLENQLKKTPIEQINLSDLISTDVIFGHRIQVRQATALRDTIESKIEQSRPKDVEKLRREFKDSIMLQYAATWNYVRK